MDRVILLYGIETIPGGSEERNWPSRLEAIWDDQKQPFAAYSWQWSGLFWKYAVGVFTWLPWYRRTINKSVVENLRSFELFIEGVTGKDESLSIVAHSYAGTLVQAALEAGMHFKRIILLATTMDEKFDWSKYSGQFDSVLVYWSDADKVVSQSTYGRQGLVGPTKLHSRVVGRYFANMGHFDWIKPVSLKLFSKEWASFLT